MRDYLWPFAFLLSESRIVDQTFSRQSCTLLFGYQKSRFYLDGRKVAIWFLCSFSSWRCMWPGLNSSNHNGLPYYLQWNVPMFSFKSIGRYSHEMVLFLLRCHLCSHHRVTDSGKLLQLRLAFRGQSSASLHTKLCDWSDSTSKETIQ